MHLACFARDNLAPRQRREQMQIDDKLVNLTPNMAVTVEINTGYRRLISYLLSPLVKYGHESLRER